MINKQELTIQPNKKTIETLSENIEFEERQLLGMMPEHDVEEFDDCLRELHIYGLIYNQSIKRIMSNYREYVEMKDKIFQQLKVINSLVREAIILTK